MAYSNFYVNYEKSDKKESDYIKEDKEEKKKPKKDNRWQTLLQIIAGMETPKSSNTVTIEYQPQQTEEKKYADPKEDPNYIPETPQPLWSPTEVRNYHNNQQMEGNVKKAYRYLTEIWGFSPESASGIIGNLVWENLANPSQTVEDSRGTTSFGVACFNSKGRLPAFEQYIQKFGMDRNKLEHQLAFIGNSIHTEQNLQALRDSTLTPERASEIFAHHFEKFAGADGVGYKNYNDPEHMRRKAAARSIYQYFNN